MSKSAEIDYIANVIKQGTPEDKFLSFLFEKPFSDPRCFDYLLDIGQIIKLLPPPPRKLLDIGVGSGWTSELFARRGYDVLGIDINPDMIELAKKREISNLKFAVIDYEQGPIPPGFHCAISYDALHHAEEERKVIAHLYNCLVDDGVLITAEPGAGHSKMPLSLEAIRKYGTTEKDMPFSKQAKIMQEVGFGSIEQFIRISQLVLKDISCTDDALIQLRHLLSLVYETSKNGLTSLVVGRKDRTRKRPDSSNVAKIALCLVNKLDAMK